MPDARFYQEQLQRAIDADPKRKGKATAVLFSIESKYDMRPYVKPLVGTKDQVDPKSLSLGDLEPYDFATAFQDSKGRIQYWERMPWGSRQNEGLYVHHTKTTVYKYSIYGVVESRSPFRPTPVPTLRKNNLEPVETAGRISPRPKPPEKAHEVLSRMMLDAFNKRRENPRGR